MTRVIMKYLLDDLSGVFSHVSVMTTRDDYRTASCRTEKWVHCRPAVSHVYLIFIKSVSFSNTGRQRPPLPG